MCPGNPAYREAKRHGNHQLRAMIEMCKRQPGPAKQRHLSRRDWGLIRAFGPKNKP